MLWPRFEFGSSRSKSINEWEYVITSLRIAMTRLTAWFATICIRVIACFFSWTTIYYSHACNYRLLNNLSLSKILQKVIVKTIMSSSNIFDINTKPTKNSFVKNNTPVVCWHLLIVLAAHKCIFRFCLKYSYK